MFSAGQTYPTSSTQSLTNPYGGAPAPQTQQYSTQPYVNISAPTPSIAVPPMPSPSFSANLGTLTNGDGIMQEQLDLQREQLTAYNTQIEGQQTNQMTATIFNGTGQVLNWIASMVGMAYNKGVIGSYYDYLNKVADNGMKVAIKQADLQESALDHAQTMQEEQIASDQRMARINANLQIRLAKVAEQGKTDRAGIYAANDAFRGGYSMGSPMLSLV
jgi:hypothetical protein